MSDNKAWIVAVDMGYGHQRPAHALRHLAYQDKIITANSYEDIVESDQKFWKKSNSFYNFISRFKKVPIIGPIFFNAFDKFQEIEKFYPKRDLSTPSFILQQIYKLIRRGWGKHLIEKLSKDPKPLICTFFTPAFMAEEYNYPGEIYLVVTDSDISRTWAPLKPKTTRIKYLAPTIRAVERLKQYGIPPKQIIFTGFPLPLENTGTEKLEHVKERILMRLKNLDPKLTYYKRYRQNVSRFLNHGGDMAYPEKADHPLTLAFAIGGAGAQKELGTDIIKSLCKNVCDALEQMCKNVLYENIHIIFIAGTHLKAKQYFEDAVKELGLEKNLGESIEMLYEKDFDSYYKKFNETLDRIDILWTKPSELSFYTALGIPIIVAPPIGSQEKMNLHWLQQIGSGVPQEDVRYTSEWLTDWLNDGLFAESAIEGFIEAPIHGTFNIEKIVFKNNKDN